MSLELRHVRASDLGPWVSQLRELERDISYPIDDGRDRFVLSHGEAYHPFFSAMGDAHFALALAGGRVVGCVAAVRKPVRVRDDEEVAAAYVGDLKVAPDWRGRGVPARLLLFALGEWARAPRQLSWRFAFGAAMRGARGDVMRAARGLSPLRLGGAFATLHVYFVEPARLAALSTTGAPASPTGGLDLSPTASAEVVSTAGAKDFVLESTGRPWPLVHLPRGPARWGASHAAALQRGGERLLREGLAGPACFALDARLVHERRFLAQQGVEPGAVATVYAFSTTTRTRGAPWVHLATSEI